MREHVITIIQQHACPICKEETEKFEGANLNVRVLNFNTPEGRAEFAMHVTKTEDQFFPVIFVDDEKFEGQVFHSYEDYLRKVRGRTEQGDNGYVL